MCFADFFPGGAGGLGEPVPLRRSGIQVPTNQVLWLLLTLAEEGIQLALAVFEKSCSKVIARSVLESAGTALNSLGTAGASFHCISQKKL